MNSDTPNTCCSEDLNRSEFLKIILGFTSVLWVALASFPIFRYLYSGTTKSEDEGSEVGTVSLGMLKDFAIDSSKNFKFGSRPAIIVRTKDGSFHAYDAVCTHLGCTVQYSGEKSRIWCACHGGQFDPVDGKNLAGPPPKPLKPFKVELISGEIIVSRA
jgi:cytochrome b6-f complex iron-sulfur subunit